MSPKHPKPPRVPTWVLFAGVAGVLTASAVLFVASRTQQDAPKPKPEQQRRGDASSSSELILPKDGGTTPTTPGGRTDLGKRRPSDDPTSTNSTTPDQDTDADTAADEARPELAALRGARITLAPANGKVVGASEPTEVQRVGTKRVRCGATSVPGALAREREVLDALEQALTRAGANVVRLDDANGAVPCAAQRSASFERSDLALVVAANVSASVASVGIAGGTLAKADTDRAALYVQSLDEATGAPAQLAPSGVVAASLVTHGVVELPKGGTVAWLGLDADADQLGADRLAGSVAAAMSTALG